LVGPVNADFLRNVSLRRGVLQRELNPPIGGLDAR
jgi:hypothetical protein